MFIPISFLRSMCLETRKLIVLIVFSIENVLTSHVLERKFDQQKLRQLLNEFKELRQEYVI